MVRLARPGLKEVERNRYYHTQTRTFRKHQVDVAFDVLGMPPRGIENCATYWAPSEQHCKMRKIREKQTYFSPMVGEARVLRFPVVEVAVSPRLLPCNPIVNDCKCLCTEAASSR